MKLTTSARALLLAATCTCSVTGFVIRPCAAPSITAPFVILMTRLQSPIRYPSFHPFAAASDSDDSSPITYVGKEEMEEILQDYAQGDSGYLVLDVGNEEEVEATGKLADDVITCPLPKQKETHAFELHADTFKEEFGFEKPHIDETLVFSCAMGKRAQMAAEMAAMDGYTNIVVYKGGANEWFVPPSVQVP